VLSRVLAAAAASLALAAPAAAGLAEVRSADGGLLAHASAAPFSYPEDGSWLTIDSAHTLPDGGVELRDVSLLGGRIRVDRLDVPGRGFAGAAISGLFVDGHEAPGQPNALASLGADGYLVVLQEAVVPGGSGKHAGLVGLRLSLTHDTLGLPAGTQFLIGLAGDPQGPSQTKLAVLGFAREPPPFVAPAGAPDPFAGDGTLGARAAALGQSFLGVPYRWGGSDPIGGFDCSGFTMYVYGQLGIQLPHFTGDQLYRGTPVARDALLPGDLVFFDYRDGAPQHEGIFIGDGKFVHAPHSGDVVRVSGMDEPGYALSYYAAVRPY
jgi:cell wall-associated NlpC family hydrolase